MLGSTFSRLGRRLDSTIVRNASKERGSMPNFLGVLEPRFAHEAWDAAFDVVPQMLAAVKKTSKEITQPSPRFTKVKKVEGAAWLEHSPDFAERRELLVPGEMVEHEGGEHPIDGCFRIWKFV